MQYWVYSVRRELSDRILNVWLLWKKNKKKKLWVQTPFVQTSGCIHWLCLYFDGNINLYTGWSLSTFRKLGIWLLGLFYEEKFLWTYVLNGLVSEIQGVQVSNFFLIVCIMYYFLIACIMADGGHLQQLLWFF